MSWSGRGQTRDSLLQAGRNIVDLIGKTYIDRNNPLITLNKTHCDDMSNISRMIRQKLIFAGEHTQSHLRKKTLERPAELGEWLSFRTYHSNTFFMVRRCFCFAYFTFCLWSYSFVTKKMGSDTWNDCRHNECFHACRLNMRAFKVRDLREIDRFFRELWCHKAFELASPRFD
jgi:hypothetical protein